MSNLIILLVCLSCGMILRQSQRFPADSYKLLGQIIVNFALPALSIVSLHKLVWRPELLGAIAMPWAMFVVGFFFFFGIGKKLGWSNEVIGTLILLGSVANTSFVGIPILLTMYGPNSIPVAILIDQAGSYLVLSVLGLSTASYFVGGAKTSALGVFKRTLTYPPFFSMLIGFALIPFNIPESINAVLTSLAQIVVPLALINVGMQLTLKGIGQDLKPLLVGLTFKLAIAPALVTLAYLVLGNGSINETQGMVILESAMGPSIAASVIASQQGLNQRLGSLMLGIGIPLCVFTTAVIYWLLKMLG